MGNENGEWIMHGVSEDDPLCIKSAEKLLEYIDEVGFLPLFRNEIPDFSVEERTAPQRWWTEDVENDPWEWRAVLARSGKVAYGKFFQRKACYVSLKWLPYLANYRRDGYDFDSRCDEGLAPHRHRRIMDGFEAAQERYSYELKAMYGGEKYFDAALSELQMQTYLTVRDFRRRINKKGQPYGWAIGVYATPESIWGYDLISSAYGEEPEESLRKILEHIRSLHPDVSEAQIIKALR